MKNMLHKLSQACQSRPVPRTERNSRAFPHKKAYTYRLSSLLPRWCTAVRAMGAIWRCSDAAAEPRGLPHRKPGRRTAPPDQPGRTWAAGGGSTVRIELRARLARKVNICVPTTHTSYNEPSKIVSQEEEPRIRYIYQIRD